MSDSVEHLILEHLRHLRAGQDLMREDLRDIKIRLTGVEENLATVHRRLDRLETRIDRIEQRLGLIEAQ